MYCLLERYDISRSVFRNITESSNHPYNRRSRERAAIRRMGARGSLAHGAHEAVPCNSGEEDRSTDPSPRGSVRTAVRQDPHPSTIPRARDCRATDTCPRIQGMLHHKYYGILVPK